MRKRRLRRAAGAAFSLRCALAKVLRVWLLCEIMENRAQADALAERLGR